VVEAGREFLTARKLGGEPGTDTTAQRDEFLAAQFVDVSISIQI